MKAVILTGGRGVRFGLVGKNKCAVKICGVPLLNYTVALCKELYDEGIVDEAIIVVGFNRRDIIDINKCNYQGMPIKYVTQRGGTAVSAILSVEQHVDGAFILFLGDEIYVNYDYKALMHIYGKTGYDGVIGYVDAGREEVKKTYTFRSRKGKVTRVEEKPRKVSNSMMGTGNCVLPMDFFSWGKVCAEVGVGDFPSVIDYGIRSKKAKFAFTKVAEKYFNINSMDEYNEAVNYLRCNM